LAKVKKLESQRSNKKTQNKSNKGGASASTLSSQNQLPGMEHHHHDMIHGCLFLPRMVKLNPRLLERSNSGGAPITTSGAAIPPKSARDSMLAKAPF
jgi:hypothetical protein